MRLLLVFPAPIRASITIGRMAGWTQSCQEGWRLHLLKRPSFYFNRQIIGNTIAVDGVGSPDRIKELDRRFEEERRGWERRV